MSEEKNQESMASDAPMENQENAQLKQEIESLKKKNYELIGKMQKKELMEVPEDYKELVKEIIVNSKKAMEQATPVTRPEIDIELTDEDVVYGEDMLEAEPLELDDFK